MKEKFLRGLKRYKFYVYTILTVMLVALLLTVIVVSTGGNKTENKTTVVSTEPVQFVMPISNATITKGYKADELQYNKTLNCWEIHKALDLFATTGDQVLACYDGIISDIYSNYLEGTTIVIKHSDGLTSKYQGLSSETKVNIGDEVKVNDVLGYVGTALQAEGEDGSHVHFELIKDGDKIDPLNYIEIGLKD